VFSHIHWKMRFYLADLGEEAGAFAAAAADTGGIAAEAASNYSVSAAAASENEAGEWPSAYRWIGREDMENLPFPNLFLRILNEFWE
jgi:A/G-specific adenine glycosylase